MFKDAFRCLNQRGDWYEGYTLVGEENDENKYTFLD